MPSKSLTLKFGADTSKLDRALKRLRKRMGKSLRGLPGRGIGLGRTAVGGAVGGALGGFAGGAFAGGVGGMAGRLFGELMDASPQFAQAMLNLGEQVRQQLQPEMESLAKSLVEATPALVKFTGKLLDGAARLLPVLTGDVKPSDPRYGTATGAVAGLKAVGDIMAGDMTGTGGGGGSEGAFVMSLLKQMIANTPQGMLLGFSDGPPTHYDPTYKGDFEGIAPGSI